MDQTYEPRNGPGYATWHMWRRVVDEAHAKRMAPALVTVSCYFEVTPMPDGLWMIAVKDDAKRTLDAIFELTATPT